MGFSLETSVPAVTVFLQGLLSFFSPCVLPLLPLYIGYLSGGTQTVAEDGSVRYKKSTVVINTLFFVVGISSAFFLLGLGFTAAGRFFSQHQTLFTRIGGILIILFGLYQLGVFGKALSKEHRLPFRPDVLAMNPVTALLLGFTFSFAWTPCVGPVLTSVLLMAASAASSSTGFLLIGVYTLGFVLPFLAAGLFTGTLLELFRKHRSVVQYTVKIGAVLMVLIGVMMLTGWMNGLSSYLSGTPSADRGTSSGSSAETDFWEPDTADTAATETAAPETVPVEETPAAPETETAAEIVAAPDFTLQDQFGNSHTFSDYQGKTVFLNFWATWCPPCKAEMPDIQALYEEYGKNSEDLVILGVATPNVGREGSAEDIAAFLEENGYTYPVVMDTDSSLSYWYGIRSYPTTFMIDTDGNVYGYVTGQLTMDIMRSIIEQTMESSGN